MTRQETADYLGVTVNRLPALVRDGMTEKLKAGTTAYTVLKPTKPSVESKRLVDIKKPISRYFHFPVSATGIL